MKIRLQIVIALLAFPYSLLSQNFLEASQRESQVSETGDPITNIIDQNGSIQGDWFYEDINQENVALKKFEDNNCVGTYYFHNGTWVNKEEFEESELLIESLRTQIVSGLESSNIYIDANQTQLAIILGLESNLVSVAILGVWENTITINLESELNTIINNMNLNLENDTFILI